MAGRHINMQLSPLPGQQRQRKFRTDLKGVTEHNDIEHKDGHDPREDKHDSDDHHHHDDDDHADEKPSAAETEAEAPKADVLEDTPPAKK